MMKKLLLSAVFAAMTFVANAQDASLNPVITTDLAATTVEDVNVDGDLFLSDVSTSFTVNAADMPISNTWGGNNNPLNVFVALKDGGTVVGNANFTSATPGVIITNVDTPNNRHDLEYTISKFNMIGTITSASVLTIDITHFNAPAGGTNPGAQDITSVSFTATTLSTPVTKIDGLVLSTASGSVSVNKGKIVSVTNILGQTVANQGLSGIYVVTVQEGAIKESIKVAL